MPYINTLITVAALAASALAVPTQAGTGFSVTQVAGVGQPLRGARAIAHAHLKHGRDVPTEVARAAKAQQSGSAAAIPDQSNATWLTPVTIGTPGVTLQLQFDTGSSDLWVFSDQMPDDMLGSVPYYSPAGSSTSKLQQGKTFNVTYGDGDNASGIVYTDKVVIGGVTAAELPVEAATSVSASILKNGGYSGLLGLGLPKGNQCQPERCEIFTEKEKSAFPAKVFCADLKNGAPGTFDFGYIDSSKYQGNIVYTDVHSTGEGDWTINMNGYSVNGVVTKGETKVIPDTGTTLMLLPSTIVSNYYASVAGSSLSSTAGGYVFPCDATLPDFGVVIKGTTFTVPGAIIANGGGTGSQDANGNDLCMGNLQVAGGADATALLGDAFLTSVYVVYDVGKTRVGFAAKSSS